MIKTTIFISLDFFRFRVTAFGKIILKLVFLILLSQKRLKILQGNQLQQNALML